MPVGGKGIEVIALEIHHGTEHVHDALAQPSLCILVYGGQCSPSLGRVSGYILIFPHRRTAHAYPWLDGLYSLVGFLGYGGNVLASPFALGHPLPVFSVGGSIGERLGVLGIADIIKMDAIHVIVFCYLLTDVGNVMGHFGQTGIEVVGVGMLLEPRGMGVCQALATDALGLCHFEAGYGDHPCMQLHASPVSFGDGKGQWVISWTAVVLACECHVPGFYLTGIDDTSSHARL